MPFTRVVILGGGPIGLLCAIEAKKYFQNVVIIEKRGGYSRNNVPSLNTPLIKHLTSIGVAKDLWPKGDPGSQSIAFSRIEESLWLNAKSSGVTMERGYVVSAITGSSKMQNGRFKRINLTLAGWDEKNKVIAQGVPPKFLITDLLVVASGGAAAHDNIVKQTLGFSFATLKAKNYAAYGIFKAPTEVGPPSGATEQEIAEYYAEPTKFRKLFSQVISDKIAFPTQDHNYLLIQLSQCTKRDFEYLKANTVALHTLLTAVSAGYMTNLLGEIKEVEKNTAVFKVSIQRARQFQSAEYPAVIVGDAAVTPHPQAGTGLTTGFAGVEQLSLLFKALAGTNRSADNSAAWMSFEQCYELYVSRKALEGTKIVLSNLIQLVERFLSDGKLTTPGSNPGFKEFLQRVINTADVLRDVLDYQRLRATKLLGILDGAPDTFDWKKCGVDQLWADIGGTYKAVKRLTADVGLFQERVDDLEAALAQRALRTKS
jgi:hypothetical protein